jgi:uncharacterized small protein (DUF1192 family)
MFDDDEAPQKPKRLPILPLDPLGVAELTAYIAELRAEIVRAEAEISRKHSHRSAAESIFGPRP